MIAIHNTKTKSNDDLILEGLAEVIADVVNKAIEDKLPAAIEKVMNSKSTDEKQVVNRKVGGGFKLPSGE